MSPRDVPESLAEPQTREPPALQLHNKAGQADQLAANYRKERDRLIHQLRAEDPQRWTYGAIATAIGCSRELGVLVLKRKR